VTPIGLSSVVDEPPHNLCGAQISFLRSYFKICIPRVILTSQAGVEKLAKNLSASTVDVTIHPKMPAVSMRRARRWACGCGGRGGAGASARSLYVPASRECGRVRGPQKPPGFGRTRCPTCSSPVQRATHRDPLSRRWRVARVRDLQHPHTHHACGVSESWRGV